jgi:hypothetical protein
MSWLIAALISFGSFALIATHLSPRFVRRAMGYAIWIDVFMHISILYMFLGTSTLGLLQAEAAGIMFSLSFRMYRWAFGYEKLTRRGWKRFAGKLTKVAA